MVFKRIYAVFMGRNLEFLRDRAALAWQFLFPVLIVIGFAFSFDERHKKELTVGVVNLPAAERDGWDFLATKYVEFIDVADSAAGRVKVERHNLDLLVEPERSRYWVNSLSSKGYVAEKMLLGARGDEGGFTKESLEGTPVRYIDWLIPGILCMNMMFSGLWGIGYVIVRYRKNGVLKRLKASPVGALEFLIAQLGSRFLIIMVNVSIIFWGLNLLFDFRMHGNYAELFLVFALGGICLVSMGLIIAARIRNEELAGGLLNLFSWPMMFLSGLWFSMENAHPFLQRFADALPLTQVTKIARAIMLDGRSLWEMPWELAYIAFFSLLCLAIGSALFKWE